MSKNELAYKLKKNLCDGNDQKIKYLKIKIVTYSLNYK